MSILCQCPRLAMIQAVQPRLVEQDATIPVRAGIRGVRKTLAFEAITHSPLQPRTISWLSLGQALALGLFLHNG